MSLLSRIEEKNRVIGSEGLHTHQGLQRQANQNLRVDPFREVKSKIHERLVSTLPQELLSGLDSPETLERLKEEVERLSLEG
jgi:hypothetical protein